ncbi:P-loop containing nucleoside triphosphate hydrolase protein [Podospora appendiculata]|uniref:P-loop containing nucleoside triphosphate hydrolase protein n=1 Tax=Podospora appendiculata TaxID=314037 RepID=A0AAE1CH60_9PEZI|nr:P-loop containing nucleoside triphosphate hydrolase protein [Podospora appendiculata]
MAPISTRSVQKTVENHVFFAPKDGGSWKSLPEFPTSAEILADRPAEYLPENLVEEPWSSEEEYLEAQYRILRCEGTEGLRSSVATFADETQRGIEMVDDGATCIYTAVRVKSYTMAKIGPIVRVEFSTKRSQYRIKWQQSKRLTPGTIVAISTKEDSFQTVCKIAAVAQRLYTGGLDQSPPLVDLMWARPNEAIFDPELELVMVESRESYFEAVRHTLVGLQHLSLTTSPFTKYLTGSNNTDMSPDFVRSCPEMDVSSIAHLSTSKDEPTISALSNYDVASDSTIQGVDDLTTLDPSQLRALHRIISKELAIVQGPPGTGKTFTSVEALKVMLAARHRRGGPPIIVSAQTNHALDLLLAHCLDAGAEIVRVGGRTTHPRIKDHTLYQTRFRWKAGPDTHYNMKALERSRKANISAIQNLVGGFFGDGLLNPKELLDAGVISPAQYDSLCDDTMETHQDLAARGPFALWLGDSLISARITQHRYPSQDERDEEHAKLVADEFEFDGDLDNIADDEEDQDCIQGIEIKLAHVWTGREPGHIGAWRDAAIRALRNNDDLYEIEPALRGVVYRHLQAALLASVTPKFTALLAQNVEICRKLKVVKWKRDVQMVNSLQIDIVGCTTTGLTKYRGLLAALHPRSLLIEEAAETREANVISALYPSIQQLILVGDHQQLAPHCDIRWLGAPPYNLNVSLFQRMVNLKTPFVMLNQQRRMKQELRKILSPFYPDLTDHPVVLSQANRPDIPGMGGRNCWFFDHTWPEETNSDQSKFNQEEAQMITGFVAYLVANGTPVEKITVLAFYHGQRKLLLNRLRRHDSLVGNTFNVFTVDSYQGEENDVVILSLVRSPCPNHNYAVGFLEDQRRAVVAISRARRGFYLFGNLDNVLGAHERSLNLWGTIWNGFAEQGCANRKLGLPIVCQQHHTETWIKEVDNWGDKSGGCDLKCQQTRPCGHLCTLKCHVTAHELLHCSEPCRNILACGHGCQRYCSEQCFCDCPRFKEIQLRQRVDASQHTQLMAEDQMPLAQRLLAASSNPSALLQAEVNRQNQKAHASQPPTSAKNTQNTTARWQEYTTIIQQHERNSPHQSRREATRAQVAPEVKDIYQPTTTVGGRRAEDGARSVHRIQLGATGSKPVAAKEGERSNTGAGPSQAPQVVKTGPNPTKADPRFATEDELARRMEKILAPGSVFAGNYYGGYSAPSKYRPSPRKLAPAAPEAPPQAEGWVSWEAIHPELADGAARAAGSKAAPADIVRPSENVARPKTATEDSSPLLIDFNEDSSSSGIAEPGPEPVVEAGAETVATASAANGPNGDDEEEWLIEL